MTNIKTITESNWETTLVGEDPIVVLCWTAWDDNSVKVKWIFEALAEEWKEKPIRFGLFNTDENVEHSRRMKITSVPISTET